PRPDPRGMLLFLLRRLVGLLPQLVAVSFLSFLLIQLAPGEYCDKLLDNPKVSKSMVDECRAYYGLDQPFLIRYARWLGRAARGDFGPSYEYMRPVFSLIKERIGN